MMTAITVLEVAFVLAILYSSLALICAGICEWVAAILGWRAATLRTGITSVLMGARDHEGRELIEGFYNHPLIRSLSRPQIGLLRWWGERNPDTPSPSYIPAMIFTDVLLELIQPPEWNSSLPMTFNDFWRIVETMPESDLKVALLNIGRTADRDVGGVRRSLQTWFNQAMDRTSGCYKRRVCLAIFAIAMALCLAFRIDTLQVISAVRPCSTTADESSLEAKRRIVPRSGNAPPIASQDPTSSTGTSKAKVSSSKSSSRDETVSPSASEPGKSDPSRSPSSPPRQRVANPIVKPLPIMQPSSAGPSPTEPEKCYLGILLSIIAVALLSPVFFDILNKVVSLRLAGARPTPSPPAAE